MVKFKAVKTDSEINQVIKLAQVIWNEHYPSIIGSDQVKYMLKNFHTKKAIKQQMTHENYQYYIIQNHEGNCGYIGFQITENALFLSKLYVLFEKRGHGLGWKSIQFPKEIALKNAVPHILLTVNKYNKNSISAYYKHGFIKTNEMCVDIGGGYFMDDYELRLDL